MRVVQVQHSTVLSSMRIPSLYPVLELEVKMDLEANILGLTMSHKYLVSKLKEKSGFKAGTFRLIMSYYHPVLEVDSKLYFESEIFNL